MEGRNGLLVEAEARLATGRAELETAPAMLDRQRSTARRRTIGADKLCDTSEFVSGCRSLGFTPHVAQNTQPPQQHDRRTNPRVALAMPRARGSSSLLADHTRGGIDAEVHR